MEMNNGVPFAFWNNEILDNKHFIRTIDIGETSIATTLIKEN